MEELISGLLVGGGASGTASALLMGFLKMFARLHAPKIYDWFKADPKRQETFAKLLGFAVGVAYGYFTGNPATVALAMGGVASFVGPEGRDILHRLILKK